MASQNESQLTLYRGYDGAGQFVWSPFVSKLECRLRISKAPYIRGIGSAPAGPRKKIPYLDLTAPDGTVAHLSDTTSIAKELIKRRILPDLNAKLTGSQKAVDVAIRAMLEEKLYFLQARERWLTHFEIMRDMVLGAVPFPQRIAAGENAKSEIIRKLDYQGIGRLTDAEMWDSIEEIWAAVDALLQESKAKAGQGECFWLLGESEPTEADATVFGFAISSQLAKAGPESAELVRTRFPTVVEYAERIQKAYFEDYESFTA